MPPRVVITGAASGIGYATARVLDASGMSVLAVDRAAGPLSRLEDDGSTISVLGADVTSSEDRERIADAAGPVDYLVNAAGVIRVSPIFEVTPGEWNEVIAVNAEAVFFLCQQFGRLLQAGGAIVNVASSAAKLATTTEVASYAASKAAVTSITRSFAYALADIPIRVNAICPGIVDTPMQEAVVAGVSSVRQVPGPVLNDRRLDAIPLKRAASADECARLIRFLLSRDSTYMTGQSINLTGGLVTW